MKFNIIVADPPYKFSDKLTMSSVKRGAESNYKSILSIEDIKKLRIQEIVEKDAILALWVPSPLLQEGMDVLQSWGFKQKQIFVWVKTKKNWLNKLLNLILAKKELQGQDQDLNKCLSFGMGRYFRQCHEVCLIGVRGSVSTKIDNKSQRSVHFHEIAKHSEKPEELQNRLETMLPTFKNKLELFARRDRAGWLCFGNECPSSLGEDIRDSIQRLINSEDITVK